MAIGTEEFNLEFQELIIPSSQVAAFDDQELGRGAYGRVYKVEYCGKRCAAKEAHLIFVEEDAQRIINSFLRECLRCSKLLHPNIVQFFGVYYPDTGGSSRLQRLPVMVMELMACNLTSFVNKNQEISTETKFCIVEDVAYGLRYLHTLKPPIVHRDLSPNNILLTTDNTAKIGDFGVSKVIQAAGKNTTAPGTPDFMPPEAHSKGPKYDSSLDVFSFAGIVLHTFTQQWPMPSNPVEFDPKTRKRVALSEVDRRKKYFDLMTGESASLKSLVEQCLDEDPTVRPSMPVVAEMIKYKGAAGAASLEQNENHSVTKESEKKYNAELYKKICTPDDSPGDPGDCYGERLPIYRLEPDGREKVSEGVFECTYGRTLVQQNVDTALTHEKILILVGATGTGKSTLINRLINHIFGVKSGDELRFQLIVEQGLTQTESQTKDITKYIIYKSELLFKFIIIDMPGLGRTAGEEEERMKVEKIKNLFASDTIMSVDAICFVTKYNEERLTSFQSYVFSTIVNIFSVDVKKNIFIMATFCDSPYDKNKNIKPAPALNLIKKEGIPFQACFPFNNRDIYVKPEHSIEFSYWETSMISFDLLFEKLATTMPVSLQLTKEVLEKRHIILNGKLPHFIKKLKDSIHVIDEHKQDLKAIEKELETIPEYHVPRIEIEMVNINEPGVFSIKCEKCNKICDYPSNIEKKSEVWWGSTMSWFNLQFRVYCTICDCSWTVHTTCKQRPVRKNVDEVLTKEKLIKKYLKEKGGKKADLIKSCENKMVSAYGDLLTHLEDIQGCIDFINKECLSRGTTLEKYFYDIIEQEREIKEDGYLKRTIVLDNLINTIKKTNIYEAFKQASDEDKLRQAQQCYNEIND